MILCIVLASRVIAVAVAALLRLLDSPAVTCRKDMSIPFSSLLLSKKRAIDLEY